MIEKNNNLGFTSILDSVAYFFTRNYRRRSFLKSELYAKYKEHIAVKPEDKSQLIFPQNTAKEEYRIVELFSQISNTQDINKKVLKKYNLSLSELMTEERITDFLDYISEIYDTKYNECIKKNTEELYIEYTDLFFIPKTYYIAAYTHVEIKNEHIKCNKYNTCEECENYHVCEIRNKILIDTFNFDINKTNDREGISSIEHIGIHQYNEQEYENVNIIKKIEKINIEVKEKYEKKYNIKEIYTSIEETNNTSINALLPTEYYINKILDIFNNISELKHEHPSEALLKKLSIVINDVNHFYKIYDTILNLKFSCEKRYILSEIHAKYQKQHYNLYGKILPDFLKCKDPSEETGRLSTDELENRVNKSVDIKPLITLRKDIFCHNPSHDILNKLHKLFGTEDITTHEISTKDKKQIWESAKRRVIGLYLYDIVDEKTVTVPLKLIREDPILKKYKYTEGNQSKLTSYLKSTRECVKYGTFMPIRIRS